MFGKLKHLFNKKSNEEVKTSMEKEKAKALESEETEEAEEFDGEKEKGAPIPEEETEETSSADEMTDEPEEPEEPEELEEPENTPEIPEAQPQVQAQEAVTREEFDALKSEIADIKTLIQNLPKQSEPVEPQMQQELDKLTALANKWNN